MVIVIIIIIATLIGTGFRLKTDPTVVQDAGMVQFFFQIPLLYCHVILSTRSNFKSSA